MKLRWLIPIVLLLPMKSIAMDDQHGKITTLTIQPGSITPVHLRPDFESVIHLPEEVTSIVAGSPGSFHVEHSEAEPTFIYYLRQTHGSHTGSERVAQNYTQLGMNKRTFIVLVSPAVFPVRFRGIFLT